MQVMYVRYINPGRLAANTLINLFASIQCDWREARYDLKRLSD